MFFPLFTFAALCHGLVIPQMLDPSSRAHSVTTELQQLLSSDSISTENGTLSFLSPAFLIDKDIVSIVSQARLKHQTLPSPQLLTIIGKINATAAKIRSKKSESSDNMKLYLFDAQERVVRDSNVVKHLTRKFIGHLSKELDENGVLLRQRLTCESDPSDPQVLFCFDPETRESFVKRDEPEVQAQLFGQVLHRVKLATEKVSDNVDYFVDSPRSFLLNIDEKFDDKIIAIADKWDEATEHLASLADNENFMMADTEGILMATEQNEVPEAVYEGYNGFQGFQVND